MSVKSHLTSGASVCPENTVTYSAGNNGQKICGVFSEAARLERSSTPPLKAYMHENHVHSTLAKQEFYVQKICGVFSEVVESIHACTVCHFPAESVHAHCIACAFSRFAHAWRRGSCTLVHSLW